VLFPPAADTFSVRESAEVILVLGFGQPALLAGVFAGLATRRLGAKLLARTIVAVGQEKLVAAKAFYQGGKKIQHPRRADQTRVSVRSRKKRPLEEERRDVGQALEENEEDGRRRRPHFQTARFTPFSVRRSQKLSTAAES